MMHIIFAANNGIFLSLAKRGGTFNFAPTATVLLIELGKITITIVALVVQMGPSRAVQAVVGVHNGETLGYRYAIPAAIYAVSNTAMIYSFMYLSAVDVYVLSQLKVLMTAGLARIVFGTQPSNVQWAALVTLMAGTAICQLGSVADQPKPEVEEEASTVAAGVTGVLIGQLCVCIGSFGSASAAIANQFLLQDRPKSLHLSNLFMYVGACQHAMVEHTCCLSSVRGHLPSYHLWLLPSCRLWLVWLPPSYHLWLLPSCHLWLLPSCRLWLLPVSISCCHWHLP
jgi:drug/metabolite transporter (DMT)-like permease